MKNIRYEIRFNDLKYQVMRQVKRHWLFDQLGVHKWKPWKKAAEFPTEREAVEFIRINIKTK